MPKVKELVEWLNKHHDPEETIVYSLWCAEDVTGLAKEKGYKKPTKIQVEEVLNNTQRHMDASIGINWDSIEAEMDGIVPRNKRS